MKLSHTGHKGTEQDAYLLNCSNYNQLVCTQSRNPNINQSRESHYSNLKDRFGVILTFFLLSTNPMKRKKQYLSNTL